jgi:alanine racemase
VGDEAESCGEDSAGGDTVRTGGRKEVRAGIPGDPATLCPCRGVRFSHLSSVMSTDPRSRAWLELDGAALRRNLASVRSRIPPGTGILPMVKANAYGLGVEGVVARLEPEDPRGYGVATTAEGVHLRELGIGRPVLVFTPPPVADLEPAIEAGLTLCVSSLASLHEVVRAANARGQRAEIHLEVDTGMGRAGVPWQVVLEDPAPFREALGAAGDQGVGWAGCFTHFHSADEPGSPGVQEQSHRFRQCLVALGAPASGAGFLVHLANSAAALRGVPGWGDLVRPGIHLYGGSVGDGWSPEPVAHLRARVVHIREARAGETLGYGSTHVAEGPERWATLSIGYGDGLPRALGNRGQVLLRGIRMPIVGRVSMDMTVVDVSGLPGGPARAGEVATLMGRDGEGEIGVDEVAGWAGTISYEVLTGLTSRLPRLWMAQGEGG